MTSSNPNPDGIEYTRLVKKKNVQIFFYKKQLQKIELITYTDVISKKKSKN